MSVWYPKNGRVIFHVDINSFYASVEAAYNPSLKGKPLAIAGNPEERRGIIVTSSYEARAKGIKTTMPLWQAKNLCPELIVLPPNFDRYRHASQEIFKLMAEITPLVQPVSIDEGYLDITDCYELGSPLDIAYNLQMRIKNELDLPCSIGIAPNKFLAKMASDMKKPMGITVLRIRDLPKKLWPRQIEEMYGVGEKTADKLRRIGVNKIGDLVEADRFTLRRILGVNGERLQERAKGIDPSPVDPDAIYDFKSIGNSETLREDTTDETVIATLLRRLARKVAVRLERKEVVAQTLQIMIRYHDRRTITRSLTHDEYFFMEDQIFAIANELFDVNWNGEPIRLLGITAQNLIEKEQAVEQLNLFTYQDHLEDEALQKVIDQLSEKYGENPFKKIKQPVNNDRPTTSFQKDFLDDYKS
ncbi:DNA polymerase IV [Amphibacillus xylanus]|uniref:DNA polymerase IV n=1 Tax=Amphibacillus xylanus (strain ATCC 51415 / DSM 6626 / JCM 7361 / LMG 17667 / NBRC 15112 / Ep01) TaxID=698758 RepID=K0IXV4_AMPXN|nr:DNA polymerase IV [Amphibacillus xylanus]BAM47325.1 DNA polymerase IV [Amphibacillus xylanus NBRC 15112]